MSGQLSNLIIRSRAEKLNARIQKQGPGAEEKLQLDPRKRQAQRQLSAAEVRRFVDAYAHGNSVRQLAMRFRVHRTTVLDHLERAGVARRPDVAKLTPADIAEATDLYPRGWSLVLISNRFAVDAETVRRTLRRVGIRLRPRRGSALPAC